MKETLKRICASIALLAGVALAFPADAQSTGPNGQAQFGNTTNLLTVDLWSARYVDMTPGSQRVVDKAGNQITGAFASDSAFTYSEPAKRYAKVGAYLYQNTSQSPSVSCVSGQTVIPWYTGGTETLADSCSRASTIWGLSRR